MKLQINLVIIVLLLTNILSACTFQSQSFCSDVGFLSEHLIVSGTIIAVDEDGIDLEVIDVLRGVETNAVIRIWDGMDFDCNGPWSMAASDLGEVGDIKILILPKKDTTNNLDGNYERPNWYSHTTDLDVADGIVKGWIRGFAYWNQNSEQIFSSDYIREIEYEAFVTSFAELFDCSTMVDVAEIINEFDINIGNPFSADLNIVFENEKFDGTISIYNLNGVAIQQTSSIYNSATIDLSFAPNGIYFVRFENKDGQQLVRKVVKQ